MENLCKHKYFPKKISPVYGNTPGMSFGGWGDLWGGQQPLLQRIWYFRKFISYKLSDYDKKLKNCSNNQIADCNFLKFKSLYKIRIYFFLCNRLMKSTFPPWSLLKSAIFFHGCLKKFAIFLTNSYNFPLLQNLQNSIFFSMTNWQIDFAEFQNK